MTVLLIAVTGLVAGLHVASWGAYKDSPYEGLRWSSLLRSPLVAIAAALALAYLIPVMRGQDLVIFIGLIYTAERLCVEWWKTIVREDDQSAYSIPMRLGLQGKPVNNPGARYGVGVLIAGAFAASCWLGALAQTFFAALPLPVFIVAAGVGGWCIAAGGAWKDAPIEGFSAWKFLRSPAVATLWAAPLATLSDNWVLVTLAAGGLSVASIETYKTFGTGGRPPGKFASKAVCSELRGTRVLLAVVHAGSWATLFAVLLAHVPWSDPDSVGRLVSAEFARTSITAACGLAAIATLWIGMRRAVANRGVRILIK